jgi:4a-hydroxytetrahydrobiopterin dehydratase
MGKLTKKKCVPCVKGTLALNKEECRAFHKELGESWDLIEEHHIEKFFTFKNFKEALAFVNAIGDVAEEEGHHPDLMLSYGKVGVKIWTHIIQGLSENDFILAAKIDALYISKTGHF